MTPYTIALIKEIVSKYGPFKRVLEIGSFSDDVKTDTQTFFSCEYVGVDIKKGKNVTHKMNGHDLYTVFPPESFDCVCTFDTLEHDDKFWLTVNQMKQILKTGGIMAIIVPSIKCPLHNHPDDYWRFMESSMDVFFEGFEILIKRNIEEFSAIHGVGRKL